ncbi:MAG: permease [Bifidobacterium aquikefiri]|uniref:Permease n=1 Tax=Bifidobacterium aquikefiri TaxID=1653207 RepID=A0A261G6Q4_9BIFI|nr:permease [Bifidobacterium aquikefiri]OZG67111.1 permease [Bifidobacterium aquikefiri]
MGSTITDVIQAGTQKTRHGFDFQHFLVAVLAIAMFILAAPLLDSTGIPVSSILSGAIGLLLQAFPFLLIGILVSSGIETFITKDFINQHFPRSAAGGMFVALFLGLCTPVCDCATVPVFARMIHKGIPLPSAVVFLCAAPIINPVVIWSTWFAFPDKPYMTLLRFIFGIIVSLIIGLSFVILPHTLSVLRPLNGAPAVRMRGMDMPASSQSQERGENSSGIGALERLKAFMQHAYHDMFQIVPYMLMGIMLASCIQVLGGSNVPGWLQNRGSIIAISFMMALAFVSSLCSSSDAVIARGFGTMFPVPAVLGFLVFGPILDIKNLLMLRALFTKRFVLRLTLTTIVVCFTAMVILAGIMRL